MSPSEHAPALRIGVVGVGHLGTHHARICHEMPGWNLTGVFDTDPGRNSEAAARYGLDPCNGLEDLLGRVEAVSICTPTDSHFEIATAAVSRGLHVFVEKPVCGTSEDAVALAAMAHEAGVTGAVGHIERFNPAINAIRSHLGVPRFIEAHRLNPFTPRGLATDVILELMIHDIDLARWLVDAEPVEIRAAGVPVLSQTDDIANCRLAFPNGCVANLTASRISANPMRKIRIFSQDHYTSVDLSAKTVESYRISGSENALTDARYATLAALGGRQIGRWSAPIPTYDALEAELSDFQEAIAQQRRPRVGLEEGARSLRVALDVARACRAQAEVVAAGRDTEGSPTVAT